MSQAQYTSFYDYWFFLVENRSFRLLWLAEVINQFGGWFTLVAAISQVESLSSRQSIAVSLLLILRAVPKVVMFPLAGAAADALNRASVIMVSALAQCAVVLLYPLAIVWSKLWLLYVLVFLQHSVSAFYDPARSALTPLIVAPQHLHLASTLDSFAWSIMAAIGSSLGGFALNGVGPVGCFFIDACSFLLAAAVAATLIPAAAAAASSPAGYSAVSSKPDCETLDGSAPAHHQNDTVLDQVLPAGVELAELKQHRHATAPKHYAALPDLEEHAVGPPPPPPSSLPTGSSRHEKRLRQRSGGCGCCCLPRAKPSSAHAIEPGLALRQGCAAMGHALGYVLRPGNGDVLVLITLKFCGGLAWGAMDVLGPRYASMSHMQLMGDQATTLGFIFASSGVGCSLGMIAVNCIPNRAAAWLKAVVGSFVFISCSYVLLMVAPNIWLVLLACILRAICSFVMWTYSYPLLQHRVDKAVQGSVFALELALYTMGECGIAVAAGVALDEGHLTLTTVCLGLAGINVVLVALWGAFSCSQLAQPTIAMCDAALQLPSPF